MSRKPRIKLDTATAYYHVMTQTTRKGMYLTDQYVPGFKDQCLTIIQSIAQVFYVKIFAWVIMDNHYHLCIEIQKPKFEITDIKRRFELLQTHAAFPKKWRPEAANRHYERFTDLSCFMSEINARMARSFNRARNETGNLWGGRFKSKIIENEASLLRVMAYIENNPVKAGLCRYPSEYAWCSAGHSQQDQNFNRSNDLPEFEFLKNIQSKDRASVYAAWIDSLTAQIAGFPSRNVNIQDPNQRQIDETILRKMKKEFEEGTPEDWSTQAYGSSEFQEKIRHAENIKKQTMTSKRKLMTKRRRCSNRELNSAKFDSMEKNSIRIARWNALNQLILLANSGRILSAIIISFP